jgi:hypothetical protein
VQWGAIASASMRVLQSPFRSGIKIEDYQLDPLIRAIQMPRVNLLIADDVGLGKTIEAGLVVQELVVRYRAALKVNTIREDLGNVGPGQLLATPAIVGYARLLMLGSDYHI